MNPVPIYWTRIRPGNRPLLLPRQILRSGHRQVPERRSSAVQGRCEFLYIRPKQPGPVCRSVGFFVEILCEPVHQFGLGLIVRGDGARHCRVHVRCDGPGSKYDVTYELNGPGAGALRADPFDRSRPVNPQVPVKPPPACTNGDCKFENCITKLFAFDVKAEANGKTALPDYNPINANSNAFVRNLVVSCGGQMSYPPYPWGFFGQMPD